MPPITRIGNVGNSQAEQMRAMLAQLGELGPLAQQFSEATGSFGPAGSNISSPLLQNALPQLLGQGMSSAEEIGARRNIGDAFRSAVGAGGFAGGSAGAFSPRATRRLAGREAQQRLAPALAGLEGQKAKIGRQGLQAGVGALTNIFGVEQQGKARERGAFGELLGGLLGGVKGNSRTPFGPTINSRSNAFGSSGLGYNPRSGQSERRF